MRNRMLIGISGLVINGFQQCYGFTVHCKSGAEVLQVFCGCILLQAVLEDSFFFLPFPKWFALVEFGHTEEFTTQSSKFASQYH